MQMSLFDDILTVSQLTEKINRVLTTDPAFKNIWVGGEISNMTRASSGHWYFSLKDNDAQLRCVMWRSSAMNQTFIARDGDAVEVRGSLALYAPRGEYQLVATQIRPTGVGELYQRFEELKARLNAEGLFDSARKRPLPPFPLRIGVVTSPTAAAFQDILNVLRRRFPLAEIILSPAQVQGIDAPPHIIRALDRLNSYGQVDIILLARGGGSIEDLWCFNDERVARAVAASQIPVVTGVGHEIDFTIVDFVSDLRAPTPSAAAEQITPHIDGVREAVRGAERQLIIAMRDKIGQLSTDLDDMTRTLRYVSPEAHISTMRQRLDAQNERTSRTLTGRLALLRERLNAKTAALHAANPDAILKRGYAIVSDDSGKPLSAIDQINTGDTVNVRLSDGQFTARVEDKRQS